MAEPTTDAAGASVNVREVVGVFHDRDLFQEAVDELLNSGFDRAELSILAGKKAVERTLGSMYEKVADLEDNPDVPRIAYVEKESLVEAKTGVVGGLAYVGALTAVGAVVASGGTVGWAIAGALLAGGGGGAVGAWISKYLGRGRAESVEAQLAKGGVLLWVRVRDGEHEQRALEILAQHSGDDVHVHDLPARPDPASDPLAGLEPDPFLPEARV